MASQFNTHGQSGHDNSSHFPAICVEFGLVVAFSTVFTAARLIAKRSVARFNTEDYFSIAAWVCVNCFVTALLVQGTKGFGKHLWDVDPSMSQVMAKMSWAIEQVYCVAMWVAKAGLLFQLQRTFAPNKKGAVFIACQCLIWINLAFYLSAWVALLAECEPTAKIWNTSIQGGHCIDNGALLIAMGIINIVSDVSIIILPIWAIWHLQMSMRMKYGISAIFATGLLAVTCSIARLVYTFEATYSTDSSYIWAPVAMWSVAEVTSIILCTCFPMMPRFYRVITGRKPDYNHDPTKPATHHGGQHSQTSHNGHASRHSSTYRCKDCINGLPCLLHDNENDDCDDNDGSTLHEKDSSSSSSPENGSLKPHRTADTNAVDDESSPRHNSSSSSTSHPPSHHPSVIRDHQPRGPSPVDNLLNSNGFITVHREFQVQRGVHSDSLGPDARLSFRDDPFTSHLTQ